MKLVEIANERDAIARVLATAGLGPRPPPRPRPPLAGQLERRVLTDHGGIKVGLWTGRVS
jgi:hypothetical protein